MFRDGQYLEVIKASDNCLATAVVTIQEKTIKIKEKKVATNKWLSLEDWVALYKILEKAILRNVQTKGSLQDFKKCKWKKFTRQLEVTYTIEVPESIKDVTSLPTIRVYVSPAKRKFEKSELHEITAGKEEIRKQVKEKTAERATEKNSNYIYQKDNTSPKKSETSDFMTKLSVETKNDRTKRYLPIHSLENNTLEEYVPDAPLTKKLCANLNYIPSRKSTLEQIQVFPNEYSPITSDNKTEAEVVRYVPNSMNSSKISYEVYEPSAVTIVNHPEEYVPNSKGIKAAVEEYHPDFTSKMMKFDDSYVPSSVRLTNENSKKLSERHKKLQSEKQMSRQKETLMKRNMDLFV